MLVLAACKPPVFTTPPPAEASAELVALTGASVMIGAGDIASCNSQADELTAALVDSVLRADSVAGVKNVVFTAGDNAYPDGSEANFVLCFTPSWGDTTKRIMREIRPSPGNHEHLNGGGAPYYKYFGDKAGSSKKGYYSYTVGDWQVLALNSEIMVNTGFTDADRKAQVDWLVAELKSGTKKCTVAYWHHPLFSSGWHGGDVRLAPFWDALYAADADLILTGHDHHYERFRPLSPAGLVDSARGMVQIVVGTGGGELRGLERVVPGSASRVQGHFGVLKLTLGTEEWRSAFLALGGNVYDPSSGRCH